MPNKAQKSPQTENDLREIWQYIAEQSAKAADAMLGRIERTFQMLAEHTRSGRVRPELVSDLRSFPVESYMIFYFIVIDGIEVVRVMHAQRDISSKDMSKEPGG